MITPKFRELMIAAETDMWKMRFWFCGSHDMTARAIVIDHLRNTILREQPDTLKRVEEIISRDMSADNGLAAYEILDAYDRNGVVGYLEWP